MALFKCKMCGGTLEVGNESVATCEYCGAQQTLPKLDDEKRANLYDRANHFRRSNEFDKAMSIYEQILNEDNTDAEAYWSIVLCRYGIEYVEDPTTHRRLPTVNRAQFTSVLADEDYKFALQYADSYQHGLYEQEAKEIDQLQKGILAISQKEDPFDIFICYKETDKAGERTHDSVLAQELYFGLKNEGFKVFFARITLEDKLGSAYEPYIFAALNSAKVMVVLGTRPEHFNAVWVKNEWSRYLALIKGGAKKTLIPAYKDMDPYDLPEEFSHLQAQDMSKLGFMQDLIRGIKKIAKADVPKTTVIKETVVTASAGNVAPLLRRAFMFLEDKDWDSANEYCEKVLDQDPENAEAYLGKLMAELRVSSRERLKELVEPFSERNNFKKALRFGNEQLKAELNGYVAHIKDRREQARLEGIYQAAQKTMSAVAIQVPAKHESIYREAAEKFRSIAGYKDADSLAQKCLAAADDVHKDGILAKAKAKMSENSIAAYNEAIGYLQTIRGWKDADDRISVCEKNIEYIKAKAEAAQLAHEQRIQKEQAEAKKRAKRNRIISFILLAVIFIGVLSVVLLNTVILPAVRYNNACSLVDEENYAEGYEALLALGSYKDSEEKAQAIYYDYLAQKLLNVSKGAHFFFGSYEQDGNSENGKEPIEWIVLSTDGTLLTAVSVHSLDYKVYHSSSNNNVTWADSSIRNWLNGTFLSAAFSMGEQGLIPELTVTTSANGYVLGGPDAVDRVFLLSIQEVNKMTSGAVCEPTAYAKGRGADNEWWLRTPGNSQRYATTYSMSVDKYGTYITSQRAVRPAVRIDLNTVAMKTTSGKYGTALSLLQQGNYADALALFKELGSYKDSAAKIAECETGLLNDRYDQAVALMAQNRFSEAKAIFESLGEHLDSAAKAEECRAAILNPRYADALALMARGQYTEAMEIFRELGDFRDCIEKIEECELAILEEKYTSALALVQGGRFVEAIEIFRELGNFRDSIAKIKECQTAIAEEQYTKAVAFMNAGKYEEAIEAFSVLDDYRDCLAKIEECRAAINQREYNKALAFIKEGSYDEAIEIFLALGNYLDSTAKIEECRIAKLETQYAEAISLTQAGRYDEAINILISLGDFRDSAARATECQYLSAHAMLNSGRYWDAYNRFLALGNYKDSVAQAAFALDIFQKQQYFDVTVGDYVTLGAFEQDNNEANGKEAIEWLVLRIDNGNTRRLLLISRYVLAAMPYHNTHEDVTWETCNLRSWLNETFYYEAFTDAERALIANSTVTASKNPAFGTNSGNATEDYVFLLRVEQLNVYLTKLSGAAALTESAAAQGAFADGNGQAWWWLLTPGRTQTYATLVLGNGSFYAAGDSVNAAKYGVRPVIWIEYELPGEAET